MSELMNFLKKTGHYFGRTFDKFPATKNRPCFIAAAAVCVCAYGARCCALRVCCFFDAPLASLRGLAAGQGGAQALTASLFAGGLRRRPAAARRPVRRPCLVCWLRQSCSRRWCPALQHSQWPRAVPPSKPEATLARQAPAHFQEPRTRAPPQGGPRTPPAVDFCSIRGLLNEASASAFTLACHWHLEQATIREILRGR